MRNLASVLLALDTSTRMVGLALYDGSQVLNESTWTSLDYHTVELAPAVAEAFKKADVGIDGIGAIAVAIGPGSFTGLRVGLALAKGLAMVRRIPLIGIPTLDVLAAAQPLLTIPMIAVVRAGRERFAVGWFQVADCKWQQTKKNTVLTLEELAQEIQTPVYISGELSHEERTFFRHKHIHAQLASPAQCLRRPAFLAELAWKRWQEGKTDNAMSLAPIYLHYNEPIPG